MNHIGRGNYTSYGLLTSAEFGNTTTTQRLKTVFLSFCVHLICRLICVCTEGERPHANLVIDY